MSTVTGGGISLLIRMPTHDISILPFASLDTIPPPRKQIIGAMLAGAAIMVVPAPRIAGRKPWIP